MNEPVFKNLNGAEQINLERHGVIEASAGTGKTYTLIEVVMRMLIEMRLPLEKILLVTFTEHATGELKARIRYRIQETLSSVNLTADVREHLKQSLLKINQASIFTIHGFCHGALREFAFEQGAVFETQVINDIDLRKIKLREMKRGWPFKPQLAAQVKSFLGDKKLSSIDDLILDLAKQYKPNIDHFYPSTEDLDESQILTALQQIDFGLLGCWETQFKNLRGLAKTSYEKLWQGVISTFLKKLQTSIKSENLTDIRSLLNFEFGSKTDVREVLLARLPAVFKTDHAKSMAAENEQVAPELFALFKQLNQILTLFNSFEAAQRVCFIPELVSELIQRTREHKSELGLISYDDMIEQLWEQLCEEQRKTGTEQLLTLALQKKYQVALIDEFQDTDIRQWEIFKQLFLSSVQRHRMFVIGDPKQAIYGFRGADVNTYLKATREIINTHQGCAYRLNINYRTHKPLIHKLNEFFSQDDAGGWFESKAVTVKAPTSTDIDPNDIPQVIENPYQLKPLNQLLVSVDKADVMKQNLALQMAQTIKNQLINQIEFRLKGERRTLVASDICVLLRGKKDAVFIEQALQQLKVPYSYHKKQDLYQSTEAIHFHVMLTALARPHEHQRINNALASLFFDLEPQQLDDFAHEKLSQINHLWLQVKEALTLKNWVKVFDLLLNDSGAMFRHRHNTRRIANIKQLKQELLTVALQQNLEANGLLKTFQHWRENRASDESLHHKDTEQAAVKIMTMHISKGLEFPVVFLFGGITGKDSDRFYKFYDESKAAMVFDLTKTHQEVYRKQQIGEAHQLFYVAMTRAVFMLFLPVIDQSEQEVHSPGIYIQTVMQRGSQLNVPIHTPAVCDVYDDRSKQPMSSKQIELMLPELPEDIHHRKRNLHSFSSLSRLQSKSNHEQVEDAFSEDLAAELMLTEEWSQQVLPVRETEIPGGVKTGLVLHGVFENVDFETINAHETLSSVLTDNAIMTVIDEQMELFKLENKPLLSDSGDSQRDYRQEMASWVWHTLKKPLHALNNMSLATVNKENRTHELSFFWSHGDTQLTGFIDLLFAVQQQGIEDYFILDWKSNLSPNGYGPDVLANEVMQKHQYNWQYQLYAMAVQRWFDALNLQNARLKGAIYVFSRGMNCQEPEQNGVFFDDFSKTNWQVAATEAELLRIDGLGIKS